jgi:hypothetical protein
MTASGSGIASVNASIRSGAPRQPVSSS